MGGRSCLQGLPSRVVGRVCRVFPNWLVAVRVVAERVLRVIRSYGSQGSVVGRAVGASA